MPGGGYRTTLKLTSSTLNDMDVLASGCHCGIVFLMLTNAEGLLLGMLDKSGAYLCWKAGPVPLERRINAVEQYKIVVHVAGRHEAVVQQEVVIAAARHDIRRRG